MVYFIEMKRIVDSEEAMKNLGQSIGRALKGGECIQLIGDVGAGKTTLTKGIALGMGITDIIQSPTFTINRTYENPGGVRLTHYDFYRLSDAGIMADELAESLSLDDTAVVVEWGDIVSDIMPDDHLTMTIVSPDETTREIELHATGDRSEAIIGAIK